MQRHMQFVRCVLSIIICFAGLASCMRNVAESGVSISSADATDGWVLFVREEGPYWLSGVWWQEIGLDPAALGYQNVLLKKGDVDTPYIWIENGEASGLLFYADVETMRTGSWGAYTVQIGKQGTAMELYSQSSSSSAECQDSSFETAVYEQNNEYRSTAPVDFPWFWNSLRPPNSLTLTIPLTRSLAGPITVTTQVWGQSSMPQDPDHHIRLIWDGTQVDDHYWDGSSSESWDVVFQSGDKTGGDLVISSPGGTEAPVELNWLDTVRITWRKSLEWTGGAWEVWIIEKESQACWKNVTGDALLGFLVAEDGTVYQADIADYRISQTGVVKGWIGTLSTAPEPPWVRKRQLIVQDELNKAEYLIIARQALHNALAPLLAKRLDDGLPVYIMTPADVYDTFGEGLPTEAAINDMVTTLVREGNLRYLLLVGDTSSGVNAPMEDILLEVPTGWVRTSVLGDTPSDYALISDPDGIPLVSVGRFPTNDIDEVSNMVKKTLDWMPNDRILFFSDDEGEFEHFIDKLAEVTPSDQRLSAATVDARQSLLSWLRKDPGILVYSGHGSLPMLGDEKILTQEDAGIWKGPTVVIAWSCLCAGFTHPSYEGLGETWMKSKQGTVAFVGPTGETSSGQQQAMAIAVQETLIDGKRIGDALLSGWRVAQSADARVGFLLLGDPALVPYPGRSE